MGIEGAVAAGIAGAGAAGIAIVGGGGGGGARGTVEIFSVPVRIVLTEGALLNGNSGVACGGGGGGGGGGGALGNIGDDFEVPFNVPESLIEFITRSFFSESIIPLFDLLAFTSARKGNPDENCDEEGISSVAEELSADLDEFGCTARFGAPCCRISWDKVLSTCTAAVGSGGADWGIGGAAIGGIFEEGWLPGAESFECCEAIFVGIASAKDLDTSGIDGAVVGAGLLEYEGKGGADGTEFFTELALRFVFPVGLPLGILGTSGALEVGNGGGTGADAKLLALAVAFECDPGIGGAPEEGTLGATLLLLTDRNLGIPPASISPS